MAKIGDGKPFEIGSCYRGVAQKSGNLQLLINTNQYCAYNRTGDYKVTVNLRPPEKGDVVIYWKGGQIMHSGYVTSLETSKVTGCETAKVTGYNCYLKEICGKDKSGERTNEDPNNKLFTDCYGYWAVYHTDRAGKRIINYKLLQLRPAASIDKNTPLDVDRWPLNVNCHGYTFTDNHLSIKGYVSPDGKIHNIQSGGNDQGIAAAFILMDNGYSEVCAEEAHTEGKDVLSLNNFLLHYCLFYDPQVFKTLYPYREHYVETDFYQKH